MRWDCGKHTILLVFSLQESHRVGQEYPVHVSEKYSCTSCSLRKFHVVGRGPDL